MRKRRCLLGLLSGAMRVYGAFVRRSVIRCWGCSLQARRSQPVRLFRKLNLRPAPPKIRKRGSGSSAKACSSRHGESRVPSEDKDLFQRAINFVTRSAFQTPCWQRMAFAQVVPRSRRRVCQTARTAQTPHAVAKPYPAPDNAPL